jgi:PAS domain S-box-containing protein
VAVKEDITEQRQLREQLRQQNAYLSFMHQMTLELLDRRQIEDLLQGIVDGASALLDAPVGAFFLSEGDGLVARACTQTLTAMVGERLERGKDAPVWRAYDSGRPVIEPNFAIEERPHHVSPTSVKVAAEFPVMAGRRCRGVLVLGRPDMDRPFSPEEVQTGMLFTQLAALVLDNAELYDAAVKEIAEHKLTQAMLQQSEARYRQIIENASDPIFLIDAERCFTYVNPTTLRALGVARAADLLGRPFSQIVAAEQRAAVDEGYLQQALQREPGGYIEYPALRADGELLWLGQNTQLIEDRSEIVGFQCIARDITAARKAQEVLRLARDQAVEASHFKSQLVARVSHELRTPLGAVIGFTELLKAGSYGELSDEQAQTVEKIRVSSEYLTSMINDLLDGAQLEARRLTLRLDRCAPRAILDHIEERMAVLAANKGLRLHSSVAPELPRNIIGDRQRLEQILTNLVGNAIKYTERGEVHVHMFQSGADRWGIRVSDTGIGIPEAELAHVFEPFYQVQLEDSQRRRGAGLGLSIAHQLVDLMGGKISVESRAGRGSVFTVLLPMERAVSNTAGLY